MHKPHKAHRASEARKRETVPFSYNEFIPTRVQSDTSTEVSKFNTINRAPKAAVLVAMASRKK